MESAAACPGEVIAAIGEVGALVSDALARIAQALDLVQAGAAGPALILAGAIQNSADALLGIRESLDGRLAVEAGILQHVYEMGVRDGRQAASPRRHLRSAG